MFLLLGVDPRIDNAIKKFNLYPLASNEFRIVTTFMDVFEWKDGLTKQELVKIVYKSQLKEKGADMARFVQNISTTLHQIRNKYTNLLLFSTPHINPKTGKREHRIFCNWDDEDVQLVLNMLIKLIEGITNTKDKINHEISKSDLKKKSEYEALIEKLKKQSEKKRKKKK